MDKPGVKARKVAVDVLTRVDKTKAFSNLALDSALTKAKLELRDSAFVTALVQGVLRHKINIDRQIEALSSQPLAKIKAPVLNVLRISIFQLEQMPDLPASAVVDTACDIARAVGHPGIVKFVNGLLRNYLRSMPPAKAELQAQDIDTLTGEPEAVREKLDELAASYSMPTWLVERWLKNFGEEETLALLKACQKPPKLTLRVNNMAIETPALQTILANSGITTTRSKLVPTCLIVEQQNERKKLEEWPGFAEGLFTVQDESAAFVSQVVAPKAGEQIIDLCAAPGGKSINLAELMEGKGKVVAVDKHESRLKLLKETRLRLALRNIETKCADGRVFKYPGGADRVLVDAPCSGTGVISKRSDLRQNRKEEDLAKLIKLQGGLLKNAATLVRPGGVLVYSTCSIEKEEGPDVIEAFLEANSDFKLESFTDAFSRECLDEMDLRAEAKAGSVMFLPSKHKVAGFYIAKLRRDMSEDIQPPLEHAQEL